MRIITGMVPPNYDFVELGYTGTKITLLTFKSGGASGRTVGTLTLAYTGDLLTSITKG